MCVLRENELSSQLCVIYLQVNEFSYLVEQVTKYSRTLWAKDFANILREKKNQDSPKYAVFFWNFKGICRSILFILHSMITRNRSEKTLRYGLSLLSVHNMFLRFGVFLCIFGAVTSTASTCTPCPSLCSCSLKSGTTDQCEVDCQGRGLKTIPTSVELPPASEIVKL